MRVITFFILLISFLFVSCKSDEEIRAEFAQVLEPKSTTTLLNDLYIGADGDIASLCRMLDSTPASIDRIRKGKTSATPAFSEKVKEVSIDYIQNDKSFSKLRSVLDNEYRWYDKVLNFPKHHPYLFWIPNIIILIIIVLEFGSGIPDLGNVYKLTIPYGVELVLFVIAGGFCLFSSLKEGRNDMYTNEINPNIEQVVVTEKNGELQVNEGYIEDLKHLLNELEEASDKDEASLSRILNVTPASINRIIQGETLPTKEFVEKIELAYSIYKKNDNSFSKLREELDTEYDWYNFVLNTPFHYPLYFWGIHIAIAIILLIPFVARKKLDIFFFVITFAEIPIFLLIWIISLFIAPSKEVQNDKYLKTTNPTVEQFIQK